IPLAGRVADGRSKEAEATTPCYISPVQVHSTSIHVVTSNPQPTQGPGLVNTFVCNCSDCRRITPSVPAFKLIVAHAPRTLSMCAGHEHPAQWQR
ncbi:hypothetical protein B0H15DRAFT_794541, partial [Mycena belliarum]